MYDEYAAHVISKYPDAFTAFVDINSYYDDTSGDVEAPVGWFGRAGRNVVSEDTQGFVYRQRCDTVAQAIAIYAELEDEYADWSDDDD